MITEPLTLYSDKVEINATPADDPLQLIRVGFLPQGSVFEANPLFAHTGDVNTIVVPAKPRLRFSHTPQGRGIAQIRRTVIDHALVNGLPEPTRDNVARKMRVYTVFEYPASLTSADSDRMTALNLMLKWHAGILQTADVVNNMLVGSF